MSYDYWKESLETVFDDHNLALTDQLFEDIWQIATMESESCGYSNIPNPLQTEIDELKRDKESMEKDHERKIQGIKEGVAMRRNVDIGDVHVNDDGDVTYDRIGPTI